MDVDGFDWDDGNWPKCGRHGVSQSEIESVFRGTPGIAGDPHHSQGEAGLRAIGRTDGGRYVFVAFTVRRRGQAVLIRPISARFMHEKEIEAYGRP